MTSGMESENSVDYSSADDVASGSLPIESVHPLTESPTEFTVILCSVLLLNLVVGVCGNASLFGLIVYIRKWSARPQRSRVPAPVTRHGTTAIAQVHNNNNQHCLKSKSNANVALYPQHSFLTNAHSTKSYIMALCFTNLFVSASMAPSIIERFIGVWLLGATVCKVHHVVGVGGNILANFLVSALTYNRRSSLCRASGLHPFTHSGLVVLGFLLITTVLVTPTAINATIEDIIVYSTDEMRVQIEKCGQVAYHDRVLLWSPFVTVLFGHILPLIMMTYLNMIILKTLYLEKANQVAVSPKEIKASFEKKAALCTATIGLLQITCSSPHWALVLFETISREEEDPPLWLPLLHLLPFISAAFSWVPAGILHEQVQQLKLFEANNSCHGDGYDETVNRRLIPDSAKLAFSERTNGVEHRPSRKMRRFEQPWAQITTEEISNESESHV